LRCWERRGWGGHDGCVRSFVLDGPLLVHGRYNTRHGLEFPPRGDQDEGPAIRDLRPGRRIGAGVDLSPAAAPRQRGDPISTSPGSSIWGPLAHGAAQVPGPSGNQRVHMTRSNASDSTDRRRR
jgi:hypothetical protein